MLSGTRCVVIDPEGEYAALLEALGALVVRVRPGTTSGLDVFRPTDDAAGTLNARIGALTTLVALLVGGVDAAGRAGVEASIASAYRGAGYADGAPVAGRVPPTLHGVADQVAAGSGLDRV